MLDISQDTLLQSPGGIHCRFIAMGAHGAKIYYSELARDIQFRNQSRLHDMGLAPACWGCFDFEGPTGKMLYAFYTDKVEVYDHSEFLALGGWDSRDANLYRAKWILRANNLKSHLKAFGVECRDCHLQNVGIDNAGGLLLIDCDFLDDSFESAVAVDGSFY